MNPPGLDALRAYLQEPKSGWTFNGALIVGVDDRLVLRIVFGFSSFENKVPMIADARFDIASIGKTIAATAAHRLAELGTIRLSDRLVDYLPGLPYAGVTVEQLLRHTSGLFDLSEDPELKKAVREFFGRPGRVFSNGDYLDFLKAVKPPASGKAGVAFRYSNTNFVLLALLLEHASGKRYDRLIEELVLRPSDMTETTICGPWAVPARADFIPGYRWEKDRGPAPDPGFSGTAAGVTYGDDDVLSTLDDLFRFARALAVGRLLRAETLRTAWKPTEVSEGPAPSSAAGFQFRIQDEKPYAYHTGGTAGFRSFLKFSSESDPLTVAFFTNVVPPGNVFQELYPELVALARSAAKAA